MKWFICCLVVIFIGVSLLVGLYTGIVFYVVDSKIAEFNRANLMILYEIKE